MFRLSSKVTRKFNNAVKDLNKIIFEPNEVEMLSFLTFRKTEFSNKDFSELNSIARKFSP